MVAKIFYPKKYYQSLTLTLTTRTVVQDYLFLRVTGRGRNDRYNTPMTFSPLQDLLSQQKIKLKVDFHLSGHVTPYSGPVVPHYVTTLLHEQSEYCGLYQIMCLSLKENYSIFLLWLFCCIVLGTVAYAS